MSERISVTLLLLAVAAQAQERKTRIDVDRYIIDADINQRTQSLAAKAAVRSLKPPPSLAARFSSAPAPAAAELTPGQRTSLKEIAKQLREILDLLDEGEHKRADTGRDET